MKDHSSLLRAHRAEIAAHAVATADCEPLLGAAERVVDAVAGRAPLSASPLSSDALRDGQEGLLLRAIETGCLDCLYRHGDGEEVRAYAVELRERFRPLHPAPQPGRRASFFSHWEQPEAPEASGEKAALHRCLATILGNLVEMVYVHDEEGVLLYANRRCEEVTGFSRGELLAPMTIFDFLPPDCLQLVADRLATLGPGPQSPFTLEILNRWGQRVPLELTLQHLALELTPGEVENFVLVCAHDCHLSRNLERQLDRVRRHERHVLEYLPLGVIVTGEDLVIVEANSPAQRGAGAPSRSDLIGVPIYAMLEEEDLALRAKLINVLESGEVWSSEYFARTRFGADIRCELTVVPLPASHDSEGGLIFLLRDIDIETNRNQARVQAQKLQALGTTIAGVSHELNNPLTGIVGYTQLLLASEIPPSIRTRVDHIALEARRAQRIVQNLLTFAQRHETRKTLHDVNQVVRNVLTLQEYQLRVDGLVVTTDLAEDLPPTLIDVNAMQTVCLHIINNAHQALRESDKNDKRLSVRTFVESNLIHVAFEDTGPGLTGELQARIFDPFFTTREPGAGPGLGLSVSYGIMQDHGGQILLKSQPGVGSTFTLVLPIREEQPEEHMMLRP